MRYSPAVNPRALRIALAAALTLAALVACVTPPSEQELLAREMASLRAAGSTEKLVMTDWARESWSVGHRAQAGNRDLVEYVHPPESVTDWSELLTIVKFWKTSRSYPMAGSTTGPILPDPSAFADACERAAQSMCPQVDFRRLDEDLTGPYPSVTFYYACPALSESSSAVPRAEVDVIRVVSGGDGLYTVMRARRAASLDETTQREWLAYLKRFAFCDSASADRPCASGAGPE